MLLSASLVVGHRAPESPTELAFRKNHYEKAKRSIGSCSQRLRKRDAVEKRFAKTDTFINNHRQAQAMDGYHSNEALKRDFIVDGLNSTCILTPESEEGPYCQFLSPLIIVEIPSTDISLSDVDGMLIRKDIRENEPGIDIRLDIQITNVNTVWGIR